MERCIPRKLVPIESSTPWINGEIRNDIAKWERLYNWFKCSKLLDILQRYKSLRDSIVSKIRLAKKTFLNNVSSSDAKKFGPQSEGFMHPQPDLSSIILTHGSVSVSSKAALLNHFFSSCFNNSITTFSILLQLRISAEIWIGLTAPLKVSVHFLRNKAPLSAGPDSITAWMLRLFADEIALTVTSLFNLSIETGKVPADWKLSNVVPILNEDTKRKMKFSPSDLFLCYRSSVVS